MVPAMTGIGALIERLREFDRLANALEVPMSERLGILNVPEMVYVDLRDGQWPAHDAIKPEFERRLSYALPLMRKLASASPGRGGASRNPGVGLRAA